MVDTAVAVVKSSVSSFEKLPLRISCIPQIECLVRLQNAAVLNTEVFEAGLAELGGYCGLRHAGTRVVLLGSAESRWLFAAALSTALLLALGYRPESSRSLAVSLRLTFNRAVFRELARSHVVKPTSKASTATS